MPCGREHRPCTTPNPLCIVDDPHGDIYPLMVVQTARCRADPDARGALFVEIIGDLDTYTASEVRPILAERVGGEPDVVVDTSGVSSINSGGLRLIEQLYELSIAGAGRFWLHDPSRIVRRVVNIIGVDDLDICEPRVARLRTLRFDPPRRSAVRQWQWDDGNDINAARMNSPMSPSSPASIRHV